MLNQCRITGFADEISDDINKQIEVLKRLDQNYIELRQAGGKNISEFSLQEAEELKKTLDRNNIAVSAIGSPIGKIGIKDDFEPHFELFCHVAKLAKIYETNNIRMFSFYIPDGDEPAIYKDQVIKRLERMIGYAKEHGLVLLHENEKGIYGEKAEQCLELMYSLHGDHFKCIFDFANFVQAGEDTRAAYILLKPYIYYIHVKDAILSDGSVVLPGHGDGHLKEIFKELDNGGYKGYLSLEPHLVNFTGLSSLEKDTQEKQMNDGAEAYCAAYLELKKLLLH